MIALVVGLMALYFIPAIVAYERLHVSRLAILMTNILFGWTFLGWAVALIWACTANVEIKKNLTLEELQSLPTYYTPKVKIERKSTVDFENDPQVISSFWLINQNTIIAAAVIVSVIFIVTFIMK